MITILNDRLKEKLNTLVGDGKPLQSVFDYHTINNKGYPYCTFELAEFYGNELDDCTNIRTYIFDLIIYQEINDNIDRQQAKNILYILLGKIIELFDKDKNLGLENVKNITPIGGGIEPVVIGKGKALVGLIKIHIDVFNNINQK